MEEKNIYKKVGRRYVPIGILCPHDDYLTDGIWIVRHRKGCTSITRGDYLADCYGLLKAGEIAKVDFPKLGAMEDYSEIAAKIIADNEIGHAPFETARKVVKALFDYNDKLKKNNDGK